MDIAGEGSHVIMTWNGLVHCGMSGVGLVHSGLGGISSKGDSDGGFNGNGAFPISSSGIALGKITGGTGVVLGTGVMLRGVASGRRKNGVGL